MHDSDLSVEHQHRSRKVTKAEARRHRRFLPFLLGAMVLLAVGLGWGFFYIQMHAMSLEDAFRLARNRYEALQQGEPQARPDGPAGEANPEAMAQLAAFPEARDRLPAVHINKPDPIDTGLKRVLREAGEDPSFIPVPFYEAVAKEISLVQADRAHPFAVRRMTEINAQVRPLLADKGLPGMLTALIWMESDAVGEFEDVQGDRLGLWALPGDTARKHGLDLTARPDPRLDPVAATRAARSYLIELFHRAGGRSFILAAMAYREGPEALDRIFLRRPSWTPEQLTLWHWQREQMIPWDTRHYLHRLLALAVLDAEAVGFGLRPADTQPGGDGSEAQEWEAPEEDE